MTSTYQRVGINVKMSRRRRERERGNCPVVKLLFIYKSLKCSFCLLELTKRTRWNASSEVETFF